MDVMKAVVFRGPNRLAIEERPKPVPRAGQAVIEITMTTICGTDVQYRAGRVSGEAGTRPRPRAGRRHRGARRGARARNTTSASASSSARSRRAASATACLNGTHSQCHGPAGGWRFGNTIDGAWAEYLLVPDARANLAPIPEQLTDEDVDPRARHPLDGDRGRGERQRAHRRQRRGLRAGPDGHLRDARREAARRGAHHRGRSRARSGSRWRGGSAPTS